MNPFYLQAQVPDITRIIRTDYIVTILVPNQLMPAA